MTTAAGASDASRHRTLHLRRLHLAPVLIFNANAGQKLGLATNAGGADAAQAALKEAEVPFEPRRTEGPGHATELAHRAVDEGRALVIAAGGDGTVGEVAQALAGSEATLGIMPLGSIMNVARTLCIPRELDAAAQTIAKGRVLAMDLGRANDIYFLEAAGVGLAAGLFGYFEQLDSKGLRRGVLRAVLRFLRQLGLPRLVIQTDGRTRRLRAPMVTVANGPFVGAAYAIAPEARIDDGLLDVVIFRGTSVVRMLFHLAAVSGGRGLPSPTGTETLRARTVRIDAAGRRTLPVHADGTAIAATPISLEVVPAALRVLIGRPAVDATCAWEQPVALTLRDRRPPIPAESDIRGGLWIFGFDRQRRELMVA